MRDPLLKAALVQAESIFGDRLERLDAISEDIRGLEHYLGSTGLQELVVIKVGDGWLSWRLAEPDRWRVVWTDESGARPLIETKADVRLRVAHALPELVRAAAASQSMRPIECTPEMVAETKALVERLGRERDERGKP